MKRQKRPGASSDAPRILVHSPHDAFFKFIFQDPTQAMAEFRSVLPPAITETIDWDTLTLHPGSYIDPDLWQRHSDLVFKATITGTRDEALVYFLFEHQSTQHTLLPFRVLVYLVRLLEDWLRAYTDQTNTEATWLLAVIPVVMYHGKTGWTPSTELCDVFRLPPSAKEALSAHLPKLRVVIDDLAQTSDDTLSAREAATVVSLMAWRLFKHAQHSPDFPARLQSWSADVEAVLQSPNGRELIHVMLRYVVETSPYLTVEDLHSVAKPIKSGHSIREVVMTLSEQLIQKGRHQGIAKSILSVLDARGIAISDEVRNRIMSEMNGSTLETWHRRAVTVSQAEGIFTEQPS